MRDNFWDPSEGLHGLYNVWSFRGLGALVSAGLGGGSLIYANVMIRKDERWFVKDRPHGRGFEYWPVTRSDLDEHYCRVEQMLNVQRYPFFDGAPYNHTPKTHALRQASQTLGLEWFLPKLAVTFANDGEPPAVGEPIKEAHPNLHGRTRYTCRLCAECDVGCNYGSKNSLDYNYLSEAKRLGAELRTRCEVRTLAPRRDGGFTVKYVRHLEENEGRTIDTRRLPLQTLTCDRLILAAGTFGTPFLLLSNRSSFRHISRRLGTQFCGNGDLLGFVFRSRVARDGKLEPRVLDPNFGTVITSTVRVPDAADDGGKGRGFYIQDAGYPSFASWLIESSELPSVIRRAFRFGATWLWGKLTKNPRSDMARDIRALMGDCELSSTSMPLLAMGRDIPDGTMRIRRGYLDVDWTTKSSEEYFSRVREHMRGIAEALRGSFSDNPIWYLKRVITVHPLGGCPMGRHVDEGVVDSYGEVFNYPNLYIADGSVMPGPVGPNPSLTIAALADRCCDHILQV